MFYLRAMRKNFHGRKNKRNRYHSLLIEEHWENIMHYRKAIEKCGADYDFFII